MSKKLLLIIGSVIVVSTAVILYLLQGGNDSEIDKNAFVSSKWEETYTPNDKNPNGTFLFNELLQFRTKKTSIFIENKLDSLALTGNKTSYFFIGDKFQLKTNELDSLLSRINTGSNLFLAYNSISENVNSYFFSSQDFVWEYNESIDVFANNKNYRFYSVNQSDTIASEWNFFPRNEFKNYKYDSVKIESSVQENPNFLSFKYGKGNIFLHCNPKIFCNYQLTSKTGYEYSSFVIQKIPKDHTIKWLEIGRIDSKEEDTEETGDEGSGKKDNSYLQFIFQHKSLTIALLLAVIGIIIYLIFRTKRSQPIVPYIPRKQNHSLLFADTIKEIYFRQQTPFSILQVIKRNFYIAVNKQFFIDISKEDKEKEIHILFEKSRFSKEKIKNLIAKLETKEENQVNFEFLNQVSKLQQEFYHETGIIKARLKSRIASKSKTINRKIIVPILLIILGLSIILASFYLLHNSIGGSIVLWPIGIILMTFGIRLYGLPVLLINVDSITYFSIFKSKQIIKFEEINSIIVENGTTLFTIKNGQKLSVNHNSISFYDINKYENFITTYIK